MAVGLGYLFGLHLPQNFRSPYKALDISDFWRRWHISLSSCLRDYLYIPLGGSRGSRWLVYRNLLITMLLGGLWHGANWTFVVWGGYHGLLLILYRSVHHFWDGLPAWIRRMLTFVLVLVGWVFFRAESLPMAAILLRRMFIWQPGSGPIGGWVLVALVCLATAITQFAPNTFELRHQWSPLATGCMAVLLGLCLLAIYGNRSTPFLYFQF